MTNYKTRFEIILLKWMLILFLVAIAIFSAEAQQLKRFAKQYHLGIEGNFGVRVLELKSNIEAIDNEIVVDEGGSLGVSAFVKPIAIRFRHGYYYSSSNVSSTIDLVRSAVTFNFYPLQVFKKNKSVLQPYLITGLQRNIFKMYGHYNPDITSSNYSTSEAPFLGRITSASIGSGAGLEYILTGENHFVKLYTEATRGTTIGDIKTNEFFSGTEMKNRANITIGVVFGYN
jgi:hypothetical protein